MRYTKGPWDICDQFVSVPRNRRDGKWDNAWICQWESYTSEANARLIAAAPDLFEYAKRQAARGCAEAKTLLRDLRKSDQS